METHDVTSMNRAGPTRIAAATDNARRMAGSVWFNAIWFQTTWFCAVLGRDQLLPVTIAMLALHLYLVRDTYRELLQLSTIASIGIAVDAAISAAGLFQFPGGVLVPLWLCCLWLAFATTLSRSLAWLGHRPLLVMLAGAIVLPLNYWAGQRLGAVSFGQPLPLVLATIGLAWAVVLPVLYRLSKLIETADGEIEAM